MRNAKAIPQYVFDTTTPFREQMEGGTVPAKRDWQPPQPAEALNWQKVMKP